MTRKLTLRHYLIIFMIFLTFVISGISYLVIQKGVRRIFIFPSVEKGRYVVEYRYLPEEPGKDDVQYFIDELLLGSGVERTKLIFTRGTSVKSCFVRKNVLFLDLSSELLEMGNSVIDIKAGVELLKKNIMHNFKKIDRIELFIDGKYAYEL